MGRVAKYKKVKSSFKDGFGSGEYVWGSLNTQKSKKRSQTSERLRRKKNKKRRHDPEDQAVPLKDDFDLNDMVGSLKKETPKNQLDCVTTSNSIAHPSSVTKNSNEKPNATVTASQIKVGNQTINAHIPTSEKEERQMLKSLGKTKQTGPSAKKTIQSRQEGESMRAFNRRLKQETEMALASNYKKVKEEQTSRNNSNNATEDKDGPLSKSQRRKEFLNQKKKKKRMRKEAESDFLDEEEEIMVRRHQGETDSFITGEAAVARASFLDQVEQPPVFAQLPRGASKKPHEKLKCKQFEAKSKLQKEESIKAEQNAMEAMRRKVQAQYSMLRQKRKAQLFLIKDTESMHQFVH